MATGCSSLSTDLSAFRVEKAPDSVYYMPNFITTSEEGDLLREVYAAPKPKWTSLSGRRLQNWGGLPHPKGMIQEELPQWLKKYAVQLGSLCVFEKKIPNHVLVNEYEPGQGIMPHEDGPLFHPVVSTINLGSHTVLDFYTHVREKDDSQEIIQQDGSTETNSSMNARHVMSLLLEPRSLLILTGDLYKNYLHGIEEKKYDSIDNRIKNLELCQAKLGQTIERSTRISLTIRHVPKTLKLKLKIGK
ncbi:alpha-ketoglutarate-dependent dioxygenase alkB homolog 6-like [Actinia tenebrosa]|uniref:Alpha-ketoglutarate-dependent dioxygenase alkB homolog 6-like n=1 Tax=Actinia tenebrosa TaxID=6105 RepID=A0A6P8H9G0_ACTTE|nr:alpha-ketoglutarate-dependent dioxygenase alkB homolog 6-like [Actinia tenebrosa]